MFDHIGVRVSDLAASTAFYRQALAPLGFALQSEDASSAGLQGGEASLWLYAGGAGHGGTHIAFRAGDRAVVDRFHRAALAAGGRDNGAPGLRADYAPTYYAAFVTDPDGNNIEAVCLKEAA
jgi:catechol 2,3-dioxygenase-like lactoylglutathione lyase family enzyme